MMARRLNFWTVLTVLFMTMAGCSTVQPAKPALTAAGNQSMGSSDAATTAIQGRDPKAEQIIRELASRGKALHAFRFKFADEFDDVRPDGRRIQMTHVRQGVVSRPGLLKIESTGDVADRTIYKDGKTVTIWDRDENIYAQIPDPGTIDQALDTLMVRYHTAVPAADFFYEDPGKSFLEQMTSSEYVGMSEIDGTACHHLAFTGGDFDWQIWVDAGDAPVLRKIAIDYKTLAGRPQYVLRVLSVEPLSAVDAAEFKFKAPTGAERVEIQPASSEETH
ncbi:DUF2092 domain-containing protein [bacterium]|nr:DUF2092 domain-containing protein [bacterium]